MLREQAERIAQASREGRLRNGHTWGVRVHGVIVDDVDADVGKRRRAICGQPVTVAQGEPRIGCVKCTRMIAVAGGQG